MSNVKFVLLHQVLEFRAVNGAKASYLFIGFGHCSSPVFAQSQRRDTLTPIYEIFFYIILELALALYLEGVSSVFSF